MLVPIILRKLSADICRNIARAHGSDQWTLNELKSAILQEIRILEAGAEYSPNSQSHFLTSTASFITGTERRPHQANTEHKKRSTCVYCGGSHTPINCDTVKDKQKHMKIIRHNMLCFNCLGKHKISLCKSKYRCRHCNRRHHTSVCNAKPPVNNSESNTGDTNSSKKADTTTLTTLTTEPLSSPKTAVCLLKTAVATVTSSDSETKTNILFDEGSQRSFLTQDVANTLSLKPHHHEDICLASFDSKHPQNKRVGIAQIHIKTNSGELLPISVLIVPTIATPLRNMFKTNVTELPHLHGLHPIMTDNDFKISSHRQ